MHWRDLPAAELEREYSPSSAIGGNYQPYIAQYIERSAAARMQFASLLRGQAHWGVAYGAAPSQTLDVFLPKQVENPLHKPPLLVFIHGGYWQELSKNESQFAAVGAVHAGWAHAVLDYTLAPAASVAQIVQECKQAIGYLAANADALGFDAQRIVVAGSSAGAHLAAMVALGAIALPDGSLRRDLVKGVLLVSGIFELEPLIHTSINAALGMDAAAAQAASPQLASGADLTNFPPACIVWGEVETAQFKAQSREFAALLAHYGAAPVLLEVPQRNHFEVVLDLCARGTPLGSAVRTLMSTR
jgi:arylformamidase